MREHDGGEDREEQERHGGGVPSDPDGAPWLGRRSGILRHGLPIPGMLLWSIPGIDGMGFFGAGVSAGFAAGFRAGVVAGFFAAACVDFAAVPRLDAEDLGVEREVDRDVDLEAAGAAARRAGWLGDGIAMPGMAPVPIVVPSPEGTRASMSRSTGSVIARSRITGSVIMRAWIASTSADTLSEDSEPAIAGTPVPVIPMAEWSIPAMLPMGLLPVLRMGMLPMSAMACAPGAVFAVALFASGPQTMVSDLASVAEA